MLNIFLINDFNKYNLHFVIKLIIKFIKLLNLLIIIYYKILLSDNPNQIKYKSKFYYQVSLFLLLSAK
jgi:hypothetical protein